MYKYASPEATRAICKALIEAEQHAVALAAETAKSRRRDLERQGLGVFAAAEENSESSFAPLAITFVNALVVGSPLDLGKDWLLHRLYSIFVEHQFLKPGEIEVFRADIRARAEDAKLSETGTDLLTSGVENALNWVAGRPVRAIELSPRGRQVHRS
jgi:hypothetical protein